MLPQATAPSELDNMRALLELFARRLDQSPSSSSVRGSSCSCIRAQLSDLSRNHLYCRHLTLRYVYPGENSFDWHVTRLHL